MTVYENLRFARFKTPSGRGLDINVMRDYFPFLRDQRTHGMQAGDLSGGERTQLALAMVLVSEPELLILDEPFAGVSPKNTGAIIDYLNASYERKPYSLLLIEQNQYLAQRLCDGISVLKQKEIFPFLEK
jgi:ABC-type branched-subunit amino acid transport system ATPase component